MTWDRRRCIRFPLTVLGTLELGDGAGAGTAFGIRITDVSAGGVGLIAGGEVPLGAAVRLLTESGELHGVVAHCERDRGHFAVGITATQDSGLLARLQWLASLSPSGHPAAQNRPPRP